MLRTALLVTAAVSVAAALVGCSGNPSGAAPVTGDILNQTGSPTAGEPSARDDAMAAISSEEFAFLFEDADLFAAVPPDAADGGLIRSLEIIPAWRRAPRLADRQIDVSVDGDIATVNVALDYGGVFLVDMNADLVFGAKPMSFRSVRTAVLTRLGNEAAVEQAGDRPRRPRHRRWELSSVSVNEFDLIDAAAQTVDITQVDVLAGDELLASFADPSALAAVDDLPVVQGDTELVVEATADVGEGAVAYLHVPAPMPRDRLNAGAADAGRDERGPRPDAGPQEQRDDGRKPPDERPRPRMARIWMADDGVAPDREAGDGIHTAVCAVGGPIGLGRIGVDIIADRTLTHEDTDNYDSAAWAVPVVIAPPEEPPPPAP